MLDGVSQNVGNSYNYNSYGGNRIDFLSNQGHNDHYDHYPSTHTHNQAHYYGNDNKSDAGSAYTYINKINELDYDSHTGQNKYTGGGNPEKTLVNPFDRKNLINGPSSYEAVDDYSYKNSYLPSNYENYAYKKEDYSSAAIPAGNTKLNFDYEGSGVGTPKAKDYGNYSSENPYTYDYDNYEKGYYNPKSNAESQKHISENYGEKNLYQSVGNKNYDSNPNLHSN